MSQSAGPGTGTTHSPGVRSRHLQPHAGLGERLRASDGEPRPVVVLAEDEEIGKERGALADFAQGMCAAFRPWVHRLAPVARLPSASARSAMPSWA